MAAGAGGENGTAQAPRLLNAPFDLIAKLGNPRAVFDRQRLEELIEILERAHVSIVVGGLVLHLVFEIGPLAPNRE